MSMLLPPIVSSTG